MHEAHPHALLVVLFVAAIATLTAFDRKNTVQWLSGMAGGAGLIGLALGSEAFGYNGALVATLLLGLALTAYQTLNSTLIMDATKPEYYGRVMSINMLSFSAMPLMAFPLGRVADVVGVQQMFAVQGIIVVGALVLVALVNPGHSFGRVPPRVYSAGVGMGPGMARPGMRPPTAVEEEPAAAPAGGQ